jgi:glycosyltransferase involved in cell wall biosynthesis
LKRFLPKRNFIDKTQEDKAEFEYCRLLRPFNPFNWFKIVRKLKEFKPDIIVNYWWSPKLAPMHIFVLSRIKAKTISICHNIIPHEKSILDNFLTKRFLKAIDYFIVHGQSEKEKLLNIFPEINVKNIVVTPLPSFENQFKYEKLTTEEARNKINLHGKVLLFFGIVRPYKGLINLLQAMPLINERYNDVTLQIVGEFWWDQRKIAEKIINELDLQNVRIIDNYVPDKDVGIYFQAADVLVIPYERGSGSGVISIAFSYNKPVVATNVGTFSEVIKDKETGLIIQPKNPQAIADAIIYLYDELNMDEVKENIEKESYRFSWDKLVDVFEEFIKQC